MNTVITALPVRRALRLVVMLCLVLGAMPAWAQGGDQQVRSKADGLFNEGRYAEAMPLYSQLVSLTPGDRTLNYRFGTCLLFSGDENRERAIGHLKFAVEDPAIPGDAWYWLGRAYHLNYRFQEAQVAYQRYRGTADKKSLTDRPVESMELQCRNGQKLLSNLKEVRVRNKVEVEDSEFFRFYDLADIGGRIVVTPDELKTSLDKKNKLRSLVYLPTKPGPIFFASYGKDGATGLDIYRTELMPDGRFATPVKLGGYVNSDLDDDYAFMHPDGKTFYFSSKGHNSMGGYDVFKAAYDRGLDAFGRPVNLDFAVNTPDDDIFYMVDAEHKEACFASGRSSRQGKLHVYRVSTDQVPLVITVLKGTYANEFDQNDRRARIVVEDALSREQVAEVRTDMNGSYVLSLPRSGKFRFLVECGPSGKTHLGLVDVPRSDGPKAYRQELSLTKQGDLEKLVIRNYFDTPLDDDLIALALDEIKRRARLDITTDEGPAAQAEPEAPAADIMTRAGFAGDVDEAKAIQLAKDDAAELDRLATELSDESGEAYRLAMESVTEAERTAREAETLIQAAAEESNEEARNARMTEAARLRQRSREANLRARSALLTGQDLENEALATRTKALAAAKLSTDLQSTLAAKKEDQALVHLTALKKQLDTRTGPDADPGIVERTRRAVGEQEREAARAMQVANTKREEEGELTDRVNRLKREMETTKSKGRKDELAREIAQYEEQLGYLRKETEVAFAKAKTMERGTAIMRGKASLTRYLASSEAGAGAGLDKTQVQGLTDRISGADDRIAGMAIDERYDALITATPAEIEARTFNWDLASAAGTTGTERVATQAADRSNTSDAARATTRTSELQRNMDGGQVEQAQDVQAPVSRDAPDAAAQSTAQSGNAGGQQPASGGGQRQPDPQAAQPPVQQAGGEVQQTGVTGEALATAEGARRAGGSDRERNVQQQDQAAPTLTPEQVRNADQGQAEPKAATGVAPIVEDPFLIENEIAELRQLASAERNRTKRDSLNARVADAEQRLALARSAGTNAANERPADQVEVGGEDEPMDLTPSEARRVPLSFDPATAEEGTITSELYADYAADKQRSASITDPVERAAALNGLELMMVDSIRAEMSRQVAIIELDPTQAERVLPRLDRLRRLRDSHRDMAAGYQQVLDVSAEVADEGDIIELPDPIQDRYVAFAPLREEVYASEVDYRSRNVDEALAFKAADLARIDSLNVRIDSLMLVMTGVTDTRERTRLRREADQLRDERYIVQVDLGQRTAYLTREEWKVAGDSLGRLERQLASKSLSAGEPLVAMASDFKSEAQRKYGQAGEQRKRADRSQDIVVRDSLYRGAYALELEALRSMDRSITVTNHLLGADHVPGEDLPYAAVAAKVLGIEEPVAEQAGNAVPAPTRTQETADAAPTTDTRTAEDARLAEQPPVTTTQRTQVPDVRTTERVENATDVPPVQPTQAAAQEVAAADPGRVDSVPQPEPAMRSEVPVAVLPPVVRPEQPMPPALQGQQQAQDASRIADTPAPTRENAAVEQAREQAQEQIRQAEARMPEASRQGVAQRYKWFLDSQGSILEPRALGTVEQPEVWAQRAGSAQKSAADLRQEAGRLRLRAAMYADSATTAKRKDRERLQLLAVRSRATADSLDGAAKAKLEEGRQAEVAKLEAEEALLVRERLVKFYYLTAEEQVMVMQNPDESIFFQRRALAMEQIDAAGEAERSAAINRELGRELVKQANNAVRADRGRAVSDADWERARVLNNEAAILINRADSLEAVAFRMREASVLNEAEAAKVLEALPSDQAGALAAMERQKRRETELAAVVPTPVTVATPTVAPPQPVEQPVSPAREEPSRTEPVVAVPPAPVTIPTPTPTPVPAATGARPEPSIPMSPEGYLLADVFEMRTPARRTTPIPVDAPMPAGIVFKVQVGAFRNELAPEAFGELTPVSGERIGNGTTRYTAGLFTGFDGAAAAKDLLRSRGYEDAFVVAYRDGQRVPLGEAMREAQRTGTTAQRVTPPSTIPEQRPAGATAEQPVVRTEPAVATQPPQPTQPPAQAAAPAQDDPATVLANYPSTAQEIIARFAPDPAATSYYNEPGAAPARQVETVQGLFFTVQVGVYSKPVPLDKLFNITPLNSERTETAKVRYTTGVYLDEGAAKIRRDEAVTLGVKDAFITAYLNGKRIPMRDARVLLQQYGPSILAKP